MGLHGVNWPGLSCDCSASNLALNWIAGLASSRAGVTSPFAAYPSPVTPQLLRALKVHKMELCLHRGSQLPLPIGRQVLAYVDGPESYPFDTFPRQVWPSQERLPLNRRRRQRPEARRPVSRALFSLDL